MGRSIQITNAHIPDSSSRTTKSSGCNATLVAKVFDVTIAIIDTPYRPTDLFIVVIAMAQKNWWRTTSFNLLDIHTRDKSSSVRQ